MRSCSQEQTAADVLRLMSTVQIRRMPVLDEADCLVGMVSLGDIAACETEGVQETLRCISTPAEPDRVGSVAAAAADAT